MFVVISTACGLLGLANLPHPIVPEYGISFHFGHLILHSIAIAMRSALRYILLAFAMIALLSGPS